MFDLLIYDKSKPHLQILRQGGNFLILYKGTSISEDKWIIFEHNNISGYWKKLDHYV